MVATMVLVSGFGGPSLDALAVSAPAAASSRKEVPAQDSIARVPAVRPQSTQVASPPSTTALSRPTGPISARIGETVQGKNWLYRVERVERPTKVENEFGPVKAKGTWLIAYLTVENIGKENFGLNSWDLELHVDNGVKYTPDTDFQMAMFLRSKGLTSLFLEKLPPTVPVASAVVFDIAPSATGLKLWLVQEKKYIDLKEER